MFTAIANFARRHFSGPSAGPRPAQPLFESLEGRQMYSVSPLTSIGLGTHPIEPVITQISSDAYANPGTEIQLTLQYTDFFGVNAASANVNNIKQVPSNSYYDLVVTSAKATTINADTVDVTYTLKSTGPQISPNIYEFSVGSSPITTPGGAAVVTGTSVATLDVFNLR